MYLETKQEKENENFNLYENGYHSQTATCSNYLQITTYKCLI